MTKSVDFESLLERRSKLIERFLFATAHLSEERRTAIIFSFMSVERVEECVQFQENRD